MGGGPIGGTGGPPLFKEGGLGSEGKPPVRVGGGGNVGAVLTGTGGGNPPVRFGGGVGRVGA